MPNAMTQARPEVAAAGDLDAVELQPGRHEAQLFHQLTSHFTLVHPGLRPGGLHEQCPVGAVGLEIDLTGWPGAPGPTVRHPACDGSSST